MSFNPDLNVPYFPMVKPAMAPAFLDLMARANGVASPRALGSGSYASQFHAVDLGCGLGTHLLYLAAAYPNASFTGIDIMPQHIEIASQIAVDAALENIQFRLTAFDDPSLKDLPAADYVTANAVYSWISSDVQEQLIELMDGLLKPGGFAFFSYNTVVGFGPAQPLRKVLYDLHRDDPNRSISEIVEATRRMLEPLAQLDPKGVAAYSLAKFERQMEGVEDDYIAHEYLSPSWTPIWTSDLARHLARAGCSFVAEADPGLYDHAYSLRASERAALDAASSQAARLNSLDLIRHQAYTSALFRREKDEREPTSDTSGDAGLLPGIQLTCAADGVEYGHDFGRLRMRYDTPTARALVSQLADGPRPMAELELISKADKEAVAGTITCFIQSGQAVPVDIPHGLEDEERTERIARLDRTLAAAQMRFPKMAQRPSLYGTPVLL